MYRSHELLIDLYKLQSHKNAHVILIVVLNFNSFRCKSFEGGGISGPLPLYKTQHNLFFFCQISYCLIIKMARND